MNGGFKKSTKKGKKTLEQIKNIKVRHFFKGLKNRFRNREKKRSSAFDDIRNAFGHINPKKAVFALLLGLLAVYMLTGIYIVDPGEQAVIRRFGAVLPQPVSEGLHYRLPFPIDQVQKVNVSEVRRADVGVNLPEHMHTEDTPQAIQLLTGDENIVASEVIVHYKVKDAAKFLYNVNNDNEQLVRLSVESALVKLMSVMKVDDILSTEKVQAQTSIMGTAQELLDNYDAGIQITEFNIQTIVPPDSVAEAFRDVNAAKEDKEKEINQANGYYNSLIPEARGKAQTMIAEAEAYKTEQINQATGEADSFKSVLKEYRKNSKIYTQDTTKYRLLLETLEKIMPKVKKYIVDATDDSIDVKLFDPSLSGGIGID